MDFSADLNYALALDAQDALAPFRRRFVIDDPDLIYLDGNSLGRLPQQTQDQMHTQVAHNWGQQLIRGWSQGWIDAPERIGGKIAGLLGAKASELIVADSTSVNLYKLALAALLARPDRHKIVTDDLNFPSDLYVLQGICQLVNRPCRVEVVSSADGIHGPLDALAEAIDEDTALVTLSHTVFKSGYTYPMAAVTQLAHQAGALTLWDLSHSAGALPVQLNGSRADLAVGCTYKYLNGGPGAPAFLYVREELQDQLGNPIAGWMGQKDAFEFQLAYQPAGGIRHFLSGTPPILSLSAVEPGVDLILEAGIDQIRQKSVQQSEYLIALWRQKLAPLGYTLNSPDESQQRGSHVSLGHPEGLRIDLALINEMKVLPDFRYPDNIRLGITPLYTSFADIYHAIDRMAQVVEKGLYHHYSVDGITVT